MVSIKGEGHSSLAEIVSVPGLTENEAKESVGEEVLDTEVIQVLSVVLGIFIVCFLK